MRLNLFESPRIAAVGAASLLLAGCASLSGPAADGSPAKAAAAAAAPLASEPARMAGGLPLRPTVAPPAPAGGASAPAGAASAARGAPPAPGALPPFDTVAKDAKKTEGLFTVWRKDEKVWLELKPEDFDKSFFFSPKISRGIGENGLFGGTMFNRGASFGRPQVVQFQKVFNQVRLLAMNTQFVAQAGTPQARGVAAGFSPSLLASTSVASAPHPERKTVLVEANPLFVNDMQGLGMTLQRTYRQGYSLDPRHSGIDNVRGKPDAVVFEVTNHYYTPSIAVPTPLPPGAPGGAPVPTTPNGLPDVRSLFFGLNFSLSKLPDAPMAPRVADPRVGYFTSSVLDFTKDIARTPKQRYVNRWRLEKKDPAAALSEPVKPITFWIDKNVPLAYRGALTDGILEWNKAFERIGFKDAVAVKVQPDDADFDTLDSGVASVRWMINSRPLFGAIGPSHVDPRTGEILDADIGFESLSSRGLRTAKSQIIGKGFTLDWAGLLQARDAVAEGALPPSPDADAHLHGAFCQHGDLAAEQLGYALEVLEARGEPVDPDSPDVQQFVLEYLKDVTMHEVGHTLGLRHNFRSSRIYSPSQLADDEFVRKTGLAGSVMEYAPLNLPRASEKPVYAFQTTLGPYDYWAIEYAYRPVDPKDEAAELRRIAARSAEPELAYGTDEDNFLGIDPESLQMDLGDDPVAFAKKRLEIGREVLARQETRVLKPDADYSVLRRALTFAVRDVGRASGILARQIGGVRTLRDFPGTGRDPLLPVAAGVQREALDALARGIFAEGSLKVSPALQRKLAPDFEERTDAIYEGETPTGTDYSFDGVTVQLRKALLAQLMSDGVATRILESAEKLPAGDAFQLSELYGRLEREIWSELAGKGDIPGPRRELQREHVNRLAGQILRPSSSRTETRSLLRGQAQGLLKRLEAAAKRPGLSADARDHLQDSAETLTQALAARMQRVGL